MRRATLALAAAGVVLAVAVPLALGGRASLAQVRAFPLHGFAGLAGLVCMNWLAKALKLRLLLLQVGLRLSVWRSLAISLGTDFAFTATPGGAAGYVANAYLLQRAEAPWPSAAAVVAADQLLDIAFFAVALPVAVVLSLEAGLLPRLPPALLAVAAALAGTLLAALGTRRGRAVLGGAARAVARRVPAIERRREALANFLRELRAQSRRLATMDSRRALAALALTALQWFGRYGILWLALDVLGHPLPFAWLLLLQALVLHLAQWTGVPAGGGGADLAMAAAMAPWVPASAIGSALLLWRFATLHLVLIAGGAGLAALAGFPAGSKRDDGHG